MDTMFELVGISYVSGEKCSIAIVQAKGTAYLIAQHMKDIFHNMTIYERKGKYPCNKQAVGMPIEIRGM